MLKLRFAAILAVALAPVVCPAQDTPYFDYISSTPPLITQNPATARFQIYVSRAESDSVPYINNQYARSVRNIINDFSPVLGRTNFSVPRRWPESLSITPHNRALRIDRWDSSPFNAVPIRASRVELDSNGWPSGDDAGENKQPRLSPDTTLRCKFTKEEQAAVEELRAGDPPSAVLQRHQFLLPESLRTPVDTQGQALRTPPSPAAKPEASRGTVASEKSGDGALVVLLMDAMCPGMAKHRSPLTYAQPVFYLDFPGETPADWRRVYSPISRQTSTIYAHLFIRDNVASLNEYVTDRSMTNSDIKSSAATSTAAHDARYSIVVQYWFFYPFNDGGNNHEGDWEHLNVHLTTASRSDRATAPSQAWLTEAEVTSILANSSAASLRIAALDYYFHHFVYTFDFVELGVYRPKYDPDKLPDPEFLWRGQGWIRDKLRSRLFLSDTGTVIKNHHPIGYIAGDNVGWDQLVSVPGGWDHNSHGTYPFIGTWREIGPLNATERIAAKMQGGGGDQEELEFLNRVARDCSFADEDRFVCFHNDSITNAQRRLTLAASDSSRIQILPDWDVIDFSEREERARWFWLVLPVRWGQPVAKSIGSGAIRHYNVGDNAPFGPAHNGGWNRPGSSSSSQSYKAHSFPEIYQIAPPDQFSTDWGYFNALKLIGTLLTPVNIGTTIFRASNDKLRRFSPKLRPPVRPLSFSLSYTPLSGDDLVRLLPISDAPQIETADRDVMAARFDEDPRWYTAQIGFGFHLSHWLMNETALSSVSERVEMLLNDVPGASIQSIDGEIRFWKLLNTTRVAPFMTGSFEPFFKIGYGYSGVWLFDCAVREAGVKRSCSTGNKTDYGPTLLSGVGVEVGTANSRIGGKDYRFRIEFTLDWTRISPDWQTSLGKERWLDSRGISLGFVYGL